MTIFLPYSITPYTIRGNIKSVYWVMKQNTLKIVIHDTKYSQSSTDTEKTHKITLGLDKKWLQV